MSTTVDYPVGVSSAITRSDCSIRPFVSSDPNMGLSKLGWVVFSGCKHKDMVAVEGTGRIKTYKTGLNESAPEVQNIADPEEKVAKIMAIRKLVARAENELNSNFTVNPKEVTAESINTDTTFWDRVTMFKSVVPDVYIQDGKGQRRVSTYWDELELNLDNVGQVLDKSLITDLLLISIIEAGGFCMVAPSYEVAVDARRYKWYLDKREATSKVKVSSKKLRDEAGSELLKLYKGDSNKLFYVSKLVSMDSLLYKIGKNMTPLDVFYDDCSKYINGEGREKDKVVACEEFLKFCNLKMDDLKVQCLIQDGTSLRLLSYKPDGTIYYLKTNTPMGKNVPECVQFLHDPLYQDIYKDLLARLEKEWAG